MRTINAGTGVEYRAAFEAQPGAPTIPGSVHWKLYNLTAKQSVQDLLEVPYIVSADGGVITEVHSIIAISGLLNVLSSSNRRSETFRLTVIADYGTARAYDTDTDYLVRNRNY